MFAIGSGELGLVSNVRNAEKVGQMVKNSKGTLSGNSRKLRGRLNLTVCEQVRTFDVGAKVVIRQCTASSGQPHMRYKGRHGTIVEKRGGCYVVKIRDGGMEKWLIASPIHLKAA